MVRPFDAYAEIASDTINSVWGESITFIKGSVQTPSTGVIEQGFPEVNDYGNVVISENWKITVKNDDTPSDIEINDSISFDKDGQGIITTFQIIDIMPDETTTKAFIVSE